MKKALFFAFAAAFLLGGAVSAEAVIYSNLRLGSRSAEVVELQDKLRGLGYLNAASTGYFGTLTRAAVVRYQLEHGISPASGIVGPLTRASLNATTPGPGPSPVPPVPNPGTGPVLNSASPATGAVGSLVTLTGSRFTTSNDIRIIAPDGTEGGIRNLNSTGNGTSLSFLFPRTLGSCDFWSAGTGYSPSSYYYPCTAPSRIVTVGTYTIYVTNEYGRSSNVQFTVTGVPNAQGPTITSLAPVSGGPGTTVTVFGSNFTATGNTVQIGFATVPNLSSYDGRTLSFTVPYSVFGFCSGGYCYGGSGSVNITVTNGLGTSNTITFLLSGNTTSPPVVSSLSPQSGPAGTTVTVFGSGFTTTGNNVQFGQTIIYNLNSSDGRTLTFTVPYLSNSCPPGAYCILGSTPITPGQYNITVSNSNGTSNAMTFYVTSNTGAVALHSATPSVVRVGNLITLRGAGFTQYGNDVHFGVGGLRAVPSYDGQTITFTVPAYVSGCDFWLGFQACTMPVQSVAPGSYPIYVSNVNGQSGSITVYVQ